MFPSRTVWSHPPSTVIEAILFPSSNPCLAGIYTSFICSKFCHINPGLDWSTSLLMPPIIGFTKYMLTLVRRRRTCPNQRRQRCMTVNASGIWANVDVLPYAIRNHTLLIITSNLYNTKDFLDIPIQSLFHFF